MYRQFKYIQLLLGVAYLSNMLVASEAKYHLLKNDHCNYGSYRTLQNDISHYTNHQQTYNSQLKANDTISDWWDLPNTLSVAQKDKKREVSYEILLLYETTFQFSRWMSFSPNVITRSIKIKPGSSLFAVYNVTTAEKPLYLHNNDIIINMNTVDSIKQMIEKYLKRRNKRKGEVIGPKITSADNTKKEITITNVGELVSLYPNQSTDIHLLQLAYETIGEINFFHLAVVPQPILRDMKWEKFFCNIKKSYKKTFYDFENVELSSIYLFTLLLQQYGVVAKKNILKMPLFWDNEKEYNKKYYLRFYFTYQSKRVNEEIKKRKELQKKFFSGVIYTILFEKYDNKKRTFECYQETYMSDKSTPAYFKKNRRANALISPINGNNLGDIMRCSMRNKILVRGYMRQLSSVYLSSLHELIILFYGAYYERSKRLLASEGKESYNNDQWQSHQSPINLNDSLKKSLIN